MAKKLTKKQIKYFGTAAQRAALKRQRSVATMPVKRHARRYFGRIKRYGRRASRGFLGSATKPLIGGAAYGVSEPFLANVPFLNTTLGKVVVGLFASSRGGIIGDAGKGILAVEAYKFSRGFGAGLGNTATGTTAITGGAASF